MVTPLCERIKNHFIVHFNWVNYSSIKLKKKKKTKERKKRKVEAWFQRAQVPG